VRRTDTRPTVSGPQSFLEVATTRRPCPAQQDQKRTQLRRLRRSGVDSAQQIELLQKDRSTQDEAGGRSQKVGALQQQQQAVKLTGVHGQRNKLASQLHWQLVVFCLLRNHTHNTTQQAWVVTLQRCARMMSTYLAQETHCIRKPLHLGLRGVSRQRERLQVHRAHLGQNPGVLDGALRAVLSQPWLRPLERR
jgi:hypothetical protein